MFYKRCSVLYFLSRTSHRGNFTSINDHKRFFSCIILWILWEPFSVFPRTLLTWQAGIQTSRSCISVLVFTGLHNRASRRTQQRPVNFEPVVPLCLGSNCSKNFTLTQRDSLQLGHLVALFENVANHTFDVAPMTQPSDSQPNLPLKVRYPKRAASRYMRNMARKETLATPCIFLRERLFG